MTSGILAVPADHRGACPRIEAAFAAALDDASVEVLHARISTILPAENRPVRDRGVHASSTAPDRGASDGGGRLIAAAKGDGWPVMGAHRCGQPIDRLIGGTTDAVMADLALSVPVLH